LVNTGIGLCGETWVAGLLRVGPNYDTHGKPTGRLSGWTYIDLSTEWPSSIPPDEGDVLPEGGVAVFWPQGFTGRGLSGGELAVVDPSGNLVAVTGRNYKLKVGLPLFTYTSGMPDATRIDGLQACGDSGNVIPQ
jgi:hypothetical protein